VENNSIPLLIENHMTNSGIIFKGKTDAIYKVIVLGDPAVGKTELLEKFTSNKFEERYLPTVGLRILKEPIELKVYNIKINLMFWDIAGQPQFYMLHRPYFNGADGMLLVFDITRSSTFSNINNWYNSAVKYGLSGIPRIVIGNKAHLAGERKIILPMAAHLGKKLNAHYYETSPLNGHNVKEVFEKIAELIYRAKLLGGSGRGGRLIVKPYRGETIKVPDEILGAPKYKHPSSNFPRPGMLQTIISKKEKKKLAKKQKREQKKKARLEKEKKEKEEEKYHRDKQLRELEILKVKKQQGFDKSFKKSSEIRLLKTSSRIKMGIGKGRSYIPLSCQLGIPGTSFRIELGLIKGIWVFRLLKGKNVINSYVFNEEDLSALGIPDPNLIIGWVLRILAIPNIKPHQITKAVHALTNQVIKNISELDLRKKSNRDGDDDDVFFPYPYIFNPPKPPDDFEMAPQVQLRAPLKEKEPEEEIYCQYCGIKLAKEEQITHSCKKKPE